MPSPHESEAIAAVRDALGRQLAALRRAAGYSQKAFAPLTGYGRSTLANVETGRQNVPRGFWVRCQEELGAGSLVAAYDEIRAMVIAERQAAAGRAQAEREARVGAWRQARRTGPHQLPGVSCGAAPNEQVALQSSESREALPAGSAEPDEDVRRHDFLALAGGAAAGIVAAPLLFGWEEPGTRRVPELNSMQLSQLQAQAEGFRWLDRQQGARVLLPATMRFAHALARLWRTTNAADDLRFELAEIAADASHLVAYQLFDQGDRHRAAEWYRCSAELAAHARAGQMYVFAMCGVAWMHAQRGDTEHALAILDQLGSFPLLAAAHCHVAIYRAQAHAEAANRDAALRELDRAEAYASASAHDAPSPWLGIPDSLFVVRQRAMVMARFGMPESLPVLAALQEHTPGAFQRYRVTLEVTRAMAHARMRQPGEAAALLADALKRNESIGSAEKMRQILEVRRVLQPERGSPEVRALDGILKR